MTVADAIKSPEDSTNQESQLNDQSERKQLHLVGGRKGGVGKTFLSLQIANYLTENQIEFGLIEADPTIGDVANVYGGQQRTQPETISINISDDPNRYNEPDIIFTQLLKTKCVLVNLPAETNDALNTWMESAELLRLCEQNNAHIYMWFITDGCFSSLKLLAGSLKLLDGQLPHIIIRNKGRLNGVDFSYLEKEGLYQNEVAEGKNVVCIEDFPVLGSAEQFFLDKYSLTYKDGVELAIDELGIIPAQRIKTFASDSRRVLDKVFDKIRAFEASKDLEELSHEPSSGVDGEKSPDLPSTNSTEETEVLATAADPELEKPLGDLPEGPVEESD